MSERPGFSRLTYREAKLSNIIMMRTHCRLERSPHKCECPEVVHSAYLVLGLHLRVCSLISEGSSHAPNLRTSITSSGKDAKGQDAKRPPKTLRRGFARLLFGENSAELD